MAMGMGGGSVLSGHGAKSQKKQKSLLLTNKCDDLFWRHFCAVIFLTDMLLLLVKGPIIKPATDFFIIVSVPFLHFA
jgi:hypothetical protein